jgi:hypothetical protein
MAGCIPQLFHAGYLMMAGRERNRHGLSGEIQKMPVLRIHPSSKNNLSYLTATGILLKPRCTSHAGQDLRMMSHSRFFFVEQKRDGILTGISVHDRSGYVQLLRPRRMRSNRYRRI